MRPMQAVALLAVMLGVPVLQSASLPQAPNGTSAPPPHSPWSQLDEGERSRILSEVSVQLAAWGPAFAQAWSNETGHPIETVAELVPVIHDAGTANLATLDAHPSQEAQMRAFWNVLDTAATALGLAMPSSPFASAWMLPGPDPDLVPEGPPSAARCSSSGAHDPVSMLLRVAASPTCLLYFAFLLVAMVVATVLDAAGLRDDVSWLTGTAAQTDAQGDKMGDDFQNEWSTRANAAINWALDLDGDELGNVEEFRWELTPICLVGFQNCRDSEASRFTGVGGDGWFDGPEVKYWNNPHNDAALDTSKGVAVLDPDRSLDLDGDTMSNVRDVDSDGDGLSDGLEALNYGSYPEFIDSDCATTPCTPVAQTTYYATNRQGKPGTGDGLNDRDESARWVALGAGKQTTDFDGDGIANNLLDPDADDDGLLDGPEFTLGRNQVRPDLLDTDADGLRDGDEAAWSEDTDLDGKVNANDPDSDGDGMPDKWEADHSFNMVDPSDALTDRDGDLLSNLGEYQHATDPDDMDSEGTTLFQGDLLTDGEEVHTYRTNPMHWDTDRDGMADRFEALHGLQPTNAADASQDPDGDSFDLGGDGTVDKAWPNVEEYRYGRPAGYDEAISGPWLQGTLPKDMDTDKDSATDGYEAHYGTSAHVPAEVGSDDDQDGLTWSQEAVAGTDARDPDTDNDGLCDGGRAPNCRFPGLGSPGHQAGEEDYGSLPWSTDSDQDGRPDGLEAILWDPSMSGQDADVDGDGLGGILDRDSDNDDLLDGQEIVVHRTDPAVPDTDADGLLDGQEVTTWSTQPKMMDTDGDGLVDGEEVKVHGTRPAIRDTDGDLLWDGDEVQVHRTDPLTSDTDQDRLPDGWEVGKGTQPRVPDGEADPDADGLSNYGEHQAYSNPLAPDTDGDSMPDGYEAQWGLSPINFADKTGDLDADGLSNHAEHAAGTSPASWDSDGDLRSDGWEVNASATNPLLADTDADGLDDGAEFNAWGSVAFLAWKADHDADTLKSLLDPDSDNDGLNDRDEFVSTRTKPHVADTDGDGLTDYTEVMTYQGQYDPTRADTDGDGQRDNVEVALADSNGDFDQDGLANGPEVGFGTDPTQPDSDCDGIEDGPEAVFWNAWSAGGGNLLNPDVDGDGIQDGVEIGTAGTPSQALYRTRPDDRDTDDDGLNDGIEARNNVRVTCGGASSTLVGPSLPGQSPAGPPLTWTDAQGLAYAVDGLGAYIQGAYGVRLYLPDLPPGVEGPRLAATGPANGRLTNPQLFDTDGDGLNDREELYGSANPYKGQSAIPTNGHAGNTNPLHCDSDEDGLGDGLELGMGASRARRSGTDPVCQQRDRDPSTLSNPNSQDTDGDTRTDMTEDSNANGWFDGVWDGYCLRITSGSTESGVSDADTDDDGMNDLEELNFGLMPGCFDSDFDGLSDGLEMARSNPVVVNGVTHTNLAQTVLGIGWPTFQKFLGNAQEAANAQGRVKVADADGDGILDGLEDVNHNGKLGDLGELRPNVLDTDGDGLSDGRELLLFGAYKFPDYVRVRGDPSSATTYDGSLLKTDPRDPNTDTVDQVIDGFDINPKGDGLMALDLGGFTQYDPIEGHICWECPRAYHTDLKMAITLETGVGDYVVRTKAIEDFGRKNEQVFFTHIEPKTKTNPTTLTYAGMKQINEVWNTLEFDLPENFTHFVKAKDFKVRVRVAAIDDDSDLARDEAVDVSPIAGHTDFYDAQGIDMAFLTGQKGLDGNGKDDGRGGDTNDGRITMSLGTTLIPFFAQNLLGIQPLGNCLGGVDELGRGCTLTRA